MSESLTAAEIASQADCWLRAADIAAAAAGRLPQRGERVAVVGCGTSWFMAQSYAALREQAGHGVTDAFAASEFPFGRTYDSVLAITRSGTTTEVLRAGTRLRSAGVPVVAITADPHTPVQEAADQLVVLDFADERSVVQTRFATTALALLRVHLGEDLTAAVADARTAVTADLPGALPAAEQTTFLGTGWTYGLAQEAALKMREAAGAWTESYPAMEYRHGPVSITGPGRTVWAFGALPPGLADDVAAVGGTLEARQDLDPLADLVRAQRLAVAVAERKGLDPDRPRNLTRSVVLG
ncbi:SIS domain-containing protein [Actinacidiphila bryophytorum]|uniref:Glucosamine-6-phosphate deaminase (Isomerizing), alternative n=1 Tax=Actinacidiphila bryophytorum TaxID=1436133 RepID=A0A9W4E6B2_9ACTN|nr:SIS domain-containing protein [Actinacidiphila bryophytorum]MBM9434421.1 SIS domain-containing protein [Actinacidiphila bryophytorum]MBN6543345.1 SIS domain-containing protein [Actinacidiphila bryophytorum]CAG7625859.1 Glucosamine-6-phosphate deaminase (isomerizing), alternative [Actinacidiphila bryophytorum]